MRGRLSPLLVCVRLLLFLLFASPVCFAQFSGSIQGVVRDETGAVLPHARITLVNQSTGVTATTTSDESGNYRFVSLAPDPYKITVEASGFAKTEAEVNLLTEQNLSIPLTLKVGTATEAITVTGETPIVDTADSRNQLTLDNSAVSELPIPGRNLVTLTTLAPGVSGLGTMGGGQPGKAGTPGSGVDNYSTETQVDASANGQGQMSNMYVIDGLDVTSGIRQGVLNLTPDPASIQETSVQVNTYSSEYSRATGVQEVMTTKSGTDTFHGSAADWYYYQNMFATTHFTGHKYLPFHGNNMSFSVGGPIIPHHQFFFFFSIEPLRSSLATNSLITFADPQFITWATQNYLNTVGTHVLSTYLPTNVSGISAISTGSSIPGCGTPSTNNLPCDLPLVDQGSFSAPQVRNGTQYFVRADKYFQNDRIYGSFYRTVLTYGAASAIPDFSALNNNWQRAFQVNWTHNFSATTVNEAIFGANRVEGVLGSGAKDYSIPSIGVTGINTEGGQAFGVGFAQGDFIQHNYHWRDVLTHVRGAHTLKFGYEGWYGDDVEPFQGPWSQPTFSFNNLLTLAQDAPTSENHVMYDPIAGKPVLWSWDAASRTWGLFAEDTWKARKNLTLTVGLRWDDEGNPWSKSATTVFGNFYLGPGQTPQEQVATGFAKATHNALNHAINNLLSPRAGVAWDITGQGATVIRGGIGLFNNWLTQANVQEEFRGSPPGPITPNFTQGTATPPLFVLGTGGKPPFGFTYPALAGSPICPTLGTNGCLNSQGGIVGANFGIGAINPNLDSPRALIWSLGVEQKLGNNLSAGVGYSGSHGYNMVGGGNQAGIVSYGQDINAFAGDLIQNNSLAPTRLNHSFGSIGYTTNDRYSNYESIYFEFKGRFARRSFFDASYTHSSSKDDASAYPAEADPSQYYGPSPWNVPNRFSLALNYELPGMNNGKGAIGLLTGGWGTSGVVVAQSGYPSMVWTTASFQPVCSNTSAGAPPCPSPSNPAVGFAPGSGDYNADGDTSGVAGVGLDYPDVANYNMHTSKAAYLAGAFSAGQFAQPAFGTQGNEKANQFGSPDFFETDLNFYKNTPITERVSFQVRFEFYNIFNRVNLTGFDINQADGTFGRATAQQLPRNWQIGGRLTF
ncbi:TonB-dependent receptor [Alloacidobacterium sp.]|uniref:TonB-dependent receptor n=1 Tax=Alloacidobacterium sp. TaxID=2951999 RepID=UPI002D2DD11D|nr:carboxypeptidase regulatory-like domain-containing protein [Alloacidobacterium sp.]HYK34979.1 carboxypeptidase regulatory-like domain-containing protein [Alloacidobacterium sp.]